MTISAGSRLGPYEIISPLGAGGMGEVYRARDTRLGRDVAIKLLPAPFASDERLRRFEREARAASSLNHPNIITIYDIGVADAVSYIAMEVVNGESLRALLVEGALPVRRLLQIGAQMAEGLSKAHAAGIVHRDLKPENVMVTEEGLVKILDFGVAKLTHPDSNDNATQVATAGATEEGVILGTVGYMSPEQATGESIDYRSDQFSFGSILYEMATGRRAFHRSSMPQTLAAIIQDEPEPIAALNPKIPVPVRWMVERCLAKEARNRYTSTEDLARDLSTIRDRLSEVVSGSGVPHLEPAVRRPRRWWIPHVVLAVILLALGIAAWHLYRADYFWKNPLAGARYTRFTDWEGSELDAAISADGKFVAFTSDRDGPFDVWVSQVGAGEFLNLSKGRYSNLVNSLIRNIGFSGDGAHVWLHSVNARFTKSSVWLLPTLGGEPRPFPANNAAEVAWSSDRTQVAYYTPDPGDPVFVADRNGENAKQILIDKPGFHNHYLTWSPDGRFIYFVRGLPPNHMDVWRIRPAGGVPERMTYHRWRVAYPMLLDNRTLIYTAPREDGASGLYAMDVERRIPHAVTSGLEGYGSIAGGALGRRLVATVENPIRSLWTVPITDRILDDASVTRFNVPSVRAAAPRFGPDYVLYLSSMGGSDGLWKFKAGVQTELWNGRDGTVVAAPAISPDGTKIAFLVRSKGQTRLYLMAPDGTNVHRIAKTLDLRDDVPSWSPDGKWIAVIVNEEEANPLVKVPVDGGAPVRLVEGVNLTPVWSPDGRFIAYSESRGSATALLRGITPDKRPFSLPDSVAVALDGNRYRFLPDGKSLVVMRGLLWQQRFFLLDLATGKQRQLADLGPEFGMQSFDVSTDGKQILFDRLRKNSDVVLIDLPPR